MATMPTVTTGAITILQGNASPLPHSAPPNISPLPPVGLPLPAAAERFQTGIAGLNSADVIARHLTLRPPAASGFFNSLMLTRPELPVSVEALEESLIGEISPEHDLSHEHTLKELSDALRASDDFICHKKLGDAAVAYLQRCGIAASCKDNGRRCQIIIEPDASSPFWLAQKAAELKTSGHLLVFDTADHRICGASNSGT